MLARVIDMLFAGLRAASLGTRQKDGKPCGLVLANQAGFVANPSEKTTEDYQGNSKAEWDLGNAATRELEGSSSGGAAGVHCALRIAQGWLQPK